MNTEKKKLFRYAVFFLVPLFGLIFSLWYIKTATFDIVYTDYVRIVNKYLPDVWSKANFFRPDVLTRIPINYPVRAFNMLVLRYSTTFDMALGAASLALAAWVFSYYSACMEVGILPFIMLMFINFSLDKWEMLTNGTGWVHFFAFAFFYGTYILFDRVLFSRGREKLQKRLLLFIVPFTTILIAGPYCGVYSAVLLLAYVCRMIYLSRHREDGGMDMRFCICGIISVAIPLLLYMWSNSYAYEDHDGAIKIGLLEMFLKDPAFFPQFFLRSLSSMFVGEETLEELCAGGIMTEGAELAMGLLLAAFYLAAFALNIVCGIYKKTVFPLLLLLYGMGNHAIILVARYIFARTDYGMSSRYALQYQAGLFGIVLTLAFACAAEEKGTAFKRKAVKALTVFFCAVMVAGHGYTTYRELQKAPYREEYGMRIGQAALHSDELSDDEVRDIFDYRESRPESAADVRRALRILRENELNIFSPARRDSLLLID